MSATDATASAEPRSASREKRSFVPNTYIVQCRNMILADIWAELGRYGLQFLRSIHLGANSSHYNYLVVFDKDFLDRKVSTSVAPVTGERGWSKVAAVTPSPSSVAATTESTTNDVVLKGAVSGTSFTLRPFFVSTEFDFKTRGGLSVVPHIIVMYPRNTNYTSSQYRKWLESALQALTLANILQPDCCKIITNVLDKEHLRRVDTNNAFIQFKANVPYEARNTVYAILRHSLWFFSLPTDSFDPIVIQATSKPSHILCQWKIAHGSTRPPPATTSS